MTATNNKLLYKHEALFFAILLTLSVLIWVLLLVKTKGLFLVFVPIGFLFYLFVQSGLISYLKGNGALISADQFPELDERVRSCVAKIGMDHIPATYIINSNGVLNAFATQFLRRHYVVLMSSIVEALREEPDALNFYIGHELGHIHRRHLMWSSILAPGSILPLIGAGYSRAREYTCDLHGAYCCEQPESAARALSALAVGAHRWKDLNMRPYLNQLKDTRGFWMSFHELVASYPWLVKRVARVSPRFPQDKMPGRNPFAYLPALFVPRLSLLSFAVIYCLVFIGTIDTMKDQFIAAALHRRQATTSGAMMPDALMPGASTPGVVTFDQNGQPQIPR